jgi:hypothetical protein
MEIDHELGLVMVLIMVQMQIVVFRLVLILKYVHNGKEDFLKITAENNMV